MTVNPCRLCAPLGAVMVFKGFRGMMPILHGSQGCATYIRRYMISHFREPVDVASSSFTEETAIFGGQAQLVTALTNVRERYNPEVVGIASTCLSETIGDDVNLFTKDLEKEGLPLVTVSTPSYQGSHIEGFRATVAAVLKRFLGSASLSPVSDSSDGRILMIPGMVSPADLRHMKELARAFGLNPVLAPDYSDTLDGGSWDAYHPMAPGGTGIDELGSFAKGAPWLSLAAGGVKNIAGEAASAVLGADGHTLSYPIGVEATDAFISALRGYADQSIPEWIEEERARLLDSYADFHKYLAGLKVAVVADSDLTDGLVRFLKEVGVSLSFAAVPDSADALIKNPANEGESIYGGVDYDTVENYLKEKGADLVIGSSKAYPASRRLEIPLVRVGFPVHDRVGGARILHLGYRGTHQLLDQLVNTVLERRQAESPVGYAYQ